MKAKIEAKKSECPYYKNIQKNNETKGRAMLINMLVKKITRFSLIFMLILIIPLINCKKQSTTPEISDLTRPIIWLNQFSMSFAAYEKGPNPSSQVLQVKNSGQQTLDYTLSADADWVKFSPDTGTSTNQANDHTISIEKDGLKAQDEEYTARITITSSQAYNNPQEVTVSLTLDEEPPPEIWINTDLLEFSAREGGSNPPSQTLRIKNTGSSRLDYEITNDAPWLDIDPTKGRIKTGKNTHTVSVNIKGLKKGSYSDTITVTDPNATNSPQQVEVSLTITEKPAPPPPPLTNNEVGISISPSSGGTGTIVTITVFIKGNTSPISTFGLKLHYNASIFQYQSTSKGTLVGSWGIVDGNVTGSGELTVGGAKFSGSSVPVGSQGSIAIVKFRVISSGAGSTTISMDTLTDDIQGMTRKPASVTFNNN